MRILISFDIDGTLEAGDPPGRVTMAMVRRAQEMGYIIGSASDRPLPVQQSIWEKQGITVDFTAHKHKLDEVKSRFVADVYQHIGDTNLDEYYAVFHGFQFLDVATATAEPWMSLDGAASAATNQHLDAEAMQNGGAPDAVIASEAEDLELIEANAKGAQALAELWARRLKQQQGNPRV